MYFVCISENDNRNNETSLSPFIQREREIFWAMFWIEVTTVKQTDKENHIRPKNNIRTSCFN